MRIAVSESWRGFPLQVKVLRILRSLIEGGCGIVGVVGKILKNIKTTVL